MVNKNSEADVDVNCPYAVWITQCIIRIESHADMLHVKSWRWYWYIFL